jgi:hypothetical protein
MPLITPRLRAPNFAPGDWINAPAPLHLPQLRGEIVLVDIWDFT